MSQFYGSIPEGTDEARTADFWTIIGLDAVGAFFKNATPKDVIGAIEMHDDN